MFCQKMAETKNKDRGVESKTNIALEILGSNVETEESNEEAEESKEVTLFFDNAIVTISEDFKKVEKDEIGMFQ